MSKIVFSQVLPTDETAIAGAKLKDNHSRDFPNRSLEEIISKHDTL